MHLREALLKASKRGYTHAKQSGSSADPKRIMVIVERKDVKEDVRSWTFGRIGPMQEPAVTLDGGTDTFFVSMSLSVMAEARVARK